MRLLLDAMWPPVLAQQLRSRGHDVRAVVEQPALRTAADPVVFDAAQIERRVLFTENVVDFRSIAADFLAGRQVHHGLIFTDNRRLPRGRRSTLGHVVTALDELLHSDIDLTCREYWLP